jgi:hypothetical protein
MEQPKHESTRSKSTISWSIWTLLLASLVINLVLTRSHLFMRQSPSHAHPLHIFTGDKAQGVQHAAAVSPDPDHVKPLECDKKGSPAAPGAPACVSDPSQLPGKGWSAAALQGQQGTALQVRSGAGQGALLLARTVSKNC